MFGHLGLLPLPLEGGGWEGVSRPSVPDNVFLSFPFRRQETVRTIVQSLARERADLGRSGRSFLGAAALRSARDLRDSVPLGGLATLAGS